MGFIIKYSRFFSVKVQEQGSDESINGFVFFPTEECRQQFKNFNLVFRSRPSGFEVFYSETPLIPIIDKIRFSFGFTISNSGLFEKYGLTGTDASDSTIYQPGLYFDNLKSDESVITGSPSSVAAKGTNKTVSAADTFLIHQQTFHVYADSEPAPTSYKLTHKFNASLTQTNPVSVPADPDPGVAYLITTINSIDLKEDYLPKTGPYLLRANTQPAPGNNVYLSDELGRTSVNGVIDIYWEGSQSNAVDGGQQYTITFKPK